MISFSASRKSHSSRSLLDLNRQLPRIETLDEFTAKFNLKSGESPLASSTPSKIRYSCSEHKTRRRPYSYMEGYCGNDSPEVIEKL